MIGRPLAHYKILEKIGSGGMGEVYLAKDTKLDRKIALKVLPPELAESKERRARFKREAKAVAALNHPNIVTVYSVEEDDGVHFITMELVKGKTVTELLPKTGFPLSKFFEVAIPLANAVAAAHQEGITHRDLKPDNMMVGDVSIYVIPSDGGKARQVTRRPEEDWWPNWSPDGEWFVFQAENRLWRVPTTGGNPELLTEAENVPRWSRDGKRVFFAGRPGTNRNLWAVSPEDGTVEAMTDLVGRQGRLSAECLATDGQFLFFAWREDLGDIWVMDVVTDESD